MRKHANNPLLPWEEGYAEGGGWWVVRKTTPPAAQAPFYHPARFAGTPPRDEEGMGGETEFGKCY